MVWFSIPICSDHTWKRLLASEFKLFIFLFLFRIWNALIQQTAFVPDEFWQSIEVAHRWVFGYGSLTWEWRSDVALRSPLHPMLIAPFYWLGKLAGLDSTRFILTVPRVLHAFLAAIADLHLYRLSIRLAGPETAKWVLFHQLANWFTAFCSPRSLANCLEWALSTVALFNYPVWSIVQGKSGLAVPRLRLFILLALGCVILRPTAVVIWGPLCLIHLWMTFSVSSGASSSGNSGRRRKQKTSALWTVFSQYLIWGLVWLACSILADRWAYGRWTMNQWNFLLFNLFGGGSQVYGVHPWHWYLSQGLPAMLLTQIPFVLVGIYSDWFVTTRGQRIPCRLLAILLVWTVFCYSLLGHKEFRFLFPLLPMTMYFCGRGTLYAMERMKKRWPNAQFSSTSTILIVCVVGTQLPVLLYTSLVHQRGTLDAIGFVNRAMERHPQPDGSYGVGAQESNVWHVLSLMPCHSVPSVGFLHKNITLRQLKCDPGLSHWFGSTEPHLDEADHFYANPVAWLMSQYNPMQLKSESYSLSPHFILLFDHLFHHVPQVEQLLLTRWRYRICGRFFHAHLLTHRRYGHHVLVLCQSDVII